MKTIHLVTDPISPVVHSQVLENVLDLINRGENIEVIFFLQLRHYFKNGAETRNKLNELGIPSSVYLVPFQTRAVGKIFACICLLWAIKTSFKQEVIIHCRGLRTSVFALMVKKIIKNKSVIYDVRGDYLAELEFSGADQIDLDKIAKTESYCLSKVDHAIFVSEHLRKTILDRYNIDALPSEVIYCSANESKAAFNQQERDRIRKEAGYTNELVFIYSGSVGLWHCLDKVIDVFEAIELQYPDARFLFLTNQKAEASDLVSNSEIKDKSKVINVTPDEVGSWLSASDVAIIIRKNHPLNFAASPVKVAEYMINGLPLIISDAIKDYSSMIEESNNGLVVTEEMLFSPPLLKISLGEFTQETWRGNRNRYENDSLNKLTRSYSVNKILNIYSGLSSTAWSSDEYLK